MPPIVKSVLAVVLGTILAGILAAGVEILGHVVYPPPPGLDPARPETITAYVERAPVGVFLFVLAAWGLGTFAGAWFAAWFAGRAPVVHGQIIGILFLAAGVANLVMIPHPLWFGVIGVAIFLPAAYLGARMVRK